VLVQIANKMGLQKKLISLVALRLMFVEQLIVAANVIGVTSIVELEPLM
jgi:hypothetical protein